MELTKYGSLTFLRGYTISTFYCLIISCCIIVLTAYQSGYAQNNESEVATLRIVDEPVIAQGEIIADREENRDANGRLAAGLIIQTDLTGLTFNSSNGIIKTAQQAGQYLLFLSPDERKVTVFREGFMPFDLILSEERIRLASGQVWEVTITGDRKLEEIPTNILVTPSDATIRIDGEIQEEVQPIALAVGKHLVQIQKQGYDSIEDTIEVSQNKNLFNFTLQEVDPQIVSITTNPEGATVILDGSNLGRSPIERFYYPGQYELRLTLEGYQEVREQIVVTDGGENNFNIDLAKNTGTLSLNVSPSNAKVLLNKQTHRTDQPIDLIPGVWKLEVSADGYKNYSEAFEIQQGEVLEKSVSLTEITGDLTVTVKPTNATVRLKKEGSTIREWRGLEFLKNLRTGRYTLEVSAPNYITKTETITVQEDEKLDTQIELLPKDGLGTISLNGIPWSARVKLNGPGSADKSFSELPASAPGVPFGQYTLTVKKKGFKPITKTIRLNQPEMRVDIYDEFRPKSKGTSLGMMLLIPGGGHFYMGRSGRGLLYLLGTGAAIGYTVNALGTLQSEVEAYSQALASYKSASANYDQAWSQVMETYDAKEAAKSQLVIGVGAFLGIRVIELLDNLFFPSPQAKLNKARIDMRSDGRLTMQYNF